ncbi:hypothetical protein DP140_26715, partial [Salmonella enterica subsp. enterica serovar Weltevreden]
MHHFQFRIGGNFTHLKLDAALVELFKGFDILFIAGERVMLLFTNPTDVERIVEGGVKVTSVNIGGMAYRQGKTQV